MSARAWQPLIDLVGPQLAGAFVWMDEYSYGHTTVQVYKHSATRLPVHIAQDGRVLDEVSGEEIDPEDALEDLFGAWREAA